MIYSKNIRFNIPQIDPVQKSIEEIEKDAARQDLRNFRRIFSMTSGKQDLKDVYESDGEKITKKEEEEEEEHCYVPPGSSVDEIEDTDEEDEPTGYNFHIFS